MNKKTMYFGIILVIIYFITVGTFISTQSPVVLTIWELLTIISGPVVLLVLLEIADEINITAKYKNLMLVFLGCNCTLTGLAHLINLCVTRKLMSQGMEIPTYYQIGYITSTETVADYLGWGFFMGLAFFSMAAGTSKEKSIQFYKISFIIDGILCMSGFIGALWINENLWYLAPAAYGIGIGILCIKGLKKTSSL